MPVRHRRVGRPRKVGRPRRRYRRGGSLKSIFGDVKRFGNRAGHFIEKNAPKVHDFIKDKKLLSSGLSLIPHPYAKIASVGAKALGYGRRRRRVHRSSPIQKLRHEGSILGYGRGSRGPRVPTNVRPIYSGGSRGGSFVRPLPGYIRRPVISRPRVGTLPYRYSQGGGGSHGRYLGAYLQGTGEQLSKVIFS